MRKEQQEVTSICQGCGASVYKQHLDSGIARYEDGKLLCSHCVVDFEKSHENSTDAGFEPIEFDDEERPSDRLSESSKHKIHGATTTTLGAVGAWDEARFKRRLNPESVGATRCRTFHCKLSGGAVDFMNAQVNDWLDQNPDIVIKFSNSCIGNFEGKHTEPNLIVTIFY